MVVLVPGAHEEVLYEDEKMALWCIAITVKSQAIQSISAPSEREANERCT